MFKRLKQSWKCIEVYPHAIAHALGCVLGHKSKNAGYREQREAVARHTSWTPDELQQAVLRQGYGSRHDKLDAFMAAWTASLSKRRRKGLGKPPDDVIWIPKLL